MNIVTGYDMQYTLQQRLAPEAPDESALYGPIRISRGAFWDVLTYDELGCFPLFGVKHVKKLTILNFRIITSLFIS